MNQKAFIKDIAYYLPEKVLTNAVIALRFPEWPAEKIANKVGITERHISAEIETACDMAFQAAEKLFEQNAGLREDIDFVILCTQSTDYKLPPSACILQDRLKLNTNCGAFDIDLGCSAYEYGLAVAKGLIVAGIASNVLLLTSETYSKYINPEDKGNLTIFGDAATATLITTEGFAEIGSFELGTDGSGADMLRVKTAGSRFPDRTGIENVDNEGNRKWDDYLYMDGGGIFNFTAEAVPAMVEQLLKKENLEESEIDLWIFHQANKYMINYLRKIMGIEKSKFYVYMDKVGNTVSNTIPIALCEARKEGLLKGNILLAGFGVGLSWGATILRCN